MKKIDQLIHDASACSPKLTGEKNFRQVWFTRGEMISLVNLVIAEGVKESTEIIEIKKEFKEGQWWVNELDNMIKSGTADQKRAVAVVHNLLTQLKNHNESP